MSGTTPIIRGEFQLTLDDFTEGAGGSANDTGRKAKFRRGLIGWLVFVALAIILVVFIRGQGTPAAPSPPGVDAAQVMPHVDTALRFLKASAVMWILFFVLIFIGLQSRIKNPKPWLDAEANPCLTSRILWVVIVLCILGAIVGRLLIGEVVFSSPTRFEYVIGAVGPALFVVAIVVAVTLSGNSNQRFWESQKPLIHPTSFEASGDGLEMTDPLSQLYYRWAYFQGYRETDNLLLLYISPYATIIIPKRAFAELSALENFKGLLLTHVPEGTLLPQASGFGVLPSR